MSRAAQMFARCLQKKAYKSFKAAAREAGRLGRGRLNISAYKCGSCGKYHVGNSHHTLASGTGCLK